MKSHNGKSTRRSMSVGQAHSTLVGGNHLLYSPKTPIGVQAYTQPTNPFSTLWKICAEDCCIDQTKEQELEELRDLRIRLKRENENLTQSKDQKEKKIGDLNETLLKEKILHKIKIAERTLKEKRILESDIRILKMQLAKKENELERLVAESTTEGLALHDFTHTNNTNNHMTLNHKATDIIDAVAEPQDYATSSEYRDERRKEHLAIRKKHTRRGKIYPFKSPLILSDNTKQRYYPSHSRDVESSDQTSNIILPIKTSTTSPKLEKLEDTMDLS